MLKTVEKHGVVNRFGQPSCDNVCKQDGGALITSYLQTFLKISYLLPTTLNSFHLVSLK